jgi:sulfite exporter TauE/SafE
MSIANLGNGSLLTGILLIIFGIIGFINAFAAFMLWFKHFTEWLERKAKSRFWFCFALVIVTFGWYAIFKLIKLL